MTHSWLCSSSVISLVLLMMVAMETPLIEGAPVKIGNNPPEMNTLDVIDTLSTYGYLPRSGNGGFQGQLMSSETFTEAIRKYQKFNGLKVTGEVDSETVRKMKSPRCGFPDILNQDNAESYNIADTLNGPQDFSVLGGRWRENTVYWKANNLTEKLNSRQQWTAFQRALDIWAEVTPLEFKYSSARPDIEIMFAKGDHGDGWGNRFDGKSGVLAHAYGPGPGMNGDVHFDDDEDWSLYTGIGSDLLHVAAHEFGHALGLGHSSTPGALMAPIYYYTDEPSLHSDDVRGIQRLYGPRISTTAKTTEETSTIPTTPTTTTQSTTPPPTPPTTTTTTTTTTSPKLPWIPDFCRTDFRLDAISKGPDGFVYVFRDRFVYKIGTRGLELHFPKLITDVFPGAPRTHIRAVTYVPTTDKTYMFKDARVWRFTGFDLDAGYPHVYSTDNNFKPSAAMTLTHNGNSQVFLFGYNYFWEWSTRTETIVPGYPLSSRRYFRSSPILPDAAYMNEEGNIFFFKYNSLRVLEHRGATPVSHPVGPSLFGPICGFNPENPEIVTLEPLRSLPAPRKPLSII